MWRKILLIGFKNKESLIRLENYFEEKLKIINIISCFYYRRSQNRAVLQSRVFVGQKQC